MIKYTTDNDVMFNSKAINNLIFCERKQIGIDNISTTVLPEHEKPSKCDFTENIKLLQKIFKINRDVPSHKKRKNSDLIYQNSLLFINFHAKHLYPTVSFRLLLALNNE